MGRREAETGCTAHMDRCTAHIDMYGSDRVKGLGSHLHLDSRLLPLCFQRRHPLLLALPPHIGDQPAGRMTPPEHLDDGGATVAGTLQLRACKGGGVRGKRYAAKG